MPDKVLHNIYIYSTISVVYHDELGEDFTLLGGLISSSDHVLYVISFISSLVIYSVMGTSH
jgi:hypothetical protein